MSDVNYLPLEPEKTSATWFLILFLILVSTVSILLITNEFNKSNKTSQSFEQNQGDEEFYSHGNILFHDDFNDNLKNHSRWQEVYDDGVWFETNGRVEFKLHEPGYGGVYEGIESKGFTVDLSPNKGVTVSWSVVTDCGSTGWVGHVCLNVTDGSSWIEACYSRYRDQLRYRDSTSNEVWMILKNNVYDGTWDNNITIFADKYKVRMKSYETSWIHKSIFSSQATLKIRLYVYTRGSSPGLYMRSGFDNVTVEKIEMLR